MSARVAGHRLSMSLLLVTAGAGIFISCALSPVVRAEGDAVAAPLSDEARYEANLRRWQSMTEEERQAIRGQAAAMSEQDRTVLKEKVKEYRSMPEQDKETLRKDFRQFRELPPERREALERGSRELRQLPPERREEIRRRVQKEPGVRDGQAHPQGARSVTGAAGVSPRGRQGEHASHPARVERRAGPAHGQDGHKENVHNPAGMHPKRKDHGGPSHPCSKNEGQGAKDEPCTDSDMKIKNDNKPSQESRNAGMVFRSSRLPNL